MAAPAIFGIGMNAWWWSTPPSSLSEYNNTTNKHSVVPTGEKQGVYFWCWFVDYEEELGTNDTFNDGSITHTFARARIAQITDNVFTATHVGWVEISGNPVKSVFQLPRVCEYTYEGGDVVLAKCRTTIVGQSYLGRSSAIQIKTLHGVLVREMVPDYGYVRGRDISGKEYPDIQFWIVVQGCARGSGDTLAATCDTLVALRDTVPGQTTSLKTLVEFIVTVPVSTSLTAVPQYADRNAGGAIADGLRANEPRGQDTRRYRQNTQAVAIPRYLTYSLFRATSQSSETQEVFILPPAPTCIDGGNAAFIEYINTPNGKNIKKDGFPEWLVCQMAILDGQGRNNLRTTYGVEYRNNMYPCEFVGPNASGKTMYRIPVNSDGYGLANYPWTPLVGVPVAYEDDPNPPRTLRNVGSGYAYITPGDDWFIADLSEPLHDYFTPYFGQVMEYEAEWVSSIPLSYNFTCSRVPYYPSDTSQLWGKIVSQVAVPTGTRVSGRCCYGFEKDGVTWYFADFSPYDLNYDAAFPDISSTYYPHVPGIYWFNSVQNPTLSVVLRDIDDPERTYHIE